jgi:hypothetical protein
MPKPKINKNEQKKLKNPSKIEKYSKKRRKSEKWLLMKWAFSEWHKSCQLSFGLNSKS